MRKSSFLFTLLIIFPEFCSIKDFASALLIPLNLPVNMNVLFFKGPLSLTCTAFAIVRFFLSSDKTFKLV